MARQDRTPDRAEVPDRPSPPAPRPARDHGDGGWGPSATGPDRDAGDGDRPRDSGHDRGRTWADPTARSRILTPTPIPATERAHYWAHPATPGVDLLRATYVRHSFGRHTHDAYALALILDGVEEFRLGAGPGGRGERTERIGPGGIGLVNPDTVHTGHAGVPEGWTYRVIYPSVELVSAVAAELGRPAGTPWFAVPVIDDRAAARAVLTAHRAAERGDRLAADASLRQALALLLHRHAAGPRSGPDAAPRPGARAPEVRRAADLLRDRLTEPPSLTDLAADSGLSPFALSRAFRREFGLPPHAWLVQQRVTAARRLLDAGTRPAEAAARAGFTDQSHLTRHFRRALGVAPGAYLRGRGAQERTRPDGSGTTSLGE